MLSTNYEAALFTGVDSEKAITTEVPTYFVKESCTAGEGLS